MKNLSKLLILFVFSFTMTFGAIDVSAQCPMCKMSAEQNLKMGGTAGKGLNRGILMMLAMPYVIVGSLGYVWLRNRRKEEEDLQEDLQD